MTDAAVPRIVEVRRAVLRQNDRDAAALRQRFGEAGVAVVSLVSSPGSGKTEFLRRTLERLREAGYAVAALVGDLETENDAKRLAEAGVPVRQILTHGRCHLEAAWVAKHLDGWDLTSLDFLFVENVGNLVCPASYDLGEAWRGVLLSVTEGEDKPRKYPSIFNTADFAVLSKIDLAEAVEFDRAAAYASIEDVRPGLRVFETSAKRGTGMDEWLSWLTALRPTPRAG
jgi:hydrogenase nickel incorporation protein HypB